MLKAIMDNVLDSNSTAVPREKHGKTSAKFLSCIIRPEKLDAVVNALVELNLIGGVTMTTVRGFGRQKGSTGHYMGVPYTIRLIDKVRVDLAISSDDVAPVIELIGKLARTGRVGDGKIFVTDLVTAMRIRTGERGIDAL